MNLEEQTEKYVIKLISFKFKPAVVIGAEYNGKRVFSYSKPCDSNMRNSLRNKLRELGDLYIQKNGKGNPIGNCAEVNVSQKLMIGNSTIPLDKIIFSTPIRPRTKQPVPICDNCKHTFDK
ncbi:hypothetical protein [Flavobacterium ustbae]|uniref:hypothetical protein n=1 Tax=Flavobacterium ustbae TaxID=2488790 RepID=UPI000F77B6A5|nr:hypothetical protein [Flavobacterium ustbae]